MKSSSPPSDPSKSKVVRFDENIQQSDSDPISNEKEDENCETTDDADDEVNPVLTSSQLNSNVQMTYVPASLALPGLFDLQHTHPKDLLPPSMHLPEQVFSFETFPLSKPSPSRNCLDLINSALECIESMDSSEKLTKGDPE